MSVMHELKIFMQDIGSEFPMLGKELSKIAKYTAQQIKEDPIKYLRDSAQDLSDMGLYHPSFEALGVETDYIPDWAKSAVKPVEVSISVQIFPVTQANLTDFCRCLKRKESLPVSRISQ